MDSKKKKPIKLDADLYDYFGKCWRTYDDDECTNMMAYHILSDNFFGKDFRISQEDEDLLISFAPKLFNTLKKENVHINYCSLTTDNKPLEAAMWGLVNEFYSYRHFNDLDFFDNRLKREHHKGSDNKKMDEKVERFQNHINSIIKLMGGRVSKNEGIHLKEHLQHALENPERYIFDNSEKIGSSIPKSKIKNYLLSLKLDHKNNTIEDFIKAIN